MSDPWRRSCLTLSPNQSGSPARSGLHVLSSPSMQREELDQVRRLYRLLVCYERVEACADRLPAGERAVLVPALADLGQVCWRQIFGGTLEVAAHRRFVLEWCLRNVELLMKEEVLPVIAHQVV